jgi:hypothetical protein
MLHCFDVVKKATRPKKEAEHHPAINSLNKIKIIRSMMTMKLKY